jgi:hypothetical protein
LGAFLQRAGVAKFFVLAFATLLAFVPVLGTELAAVALFAAVYFWQRKRAGAMGQQKADEAVEIAIK